MGNADCTRSGTRLAMLVVLAFALSACGDVAPAREVEDALGALPTLETVPTATAMFATPSPPPGGGRPTLGVTETELSCDVRQRISGYGFEPNTTVTVLSRVPGSATVYEAGATGVLSDGSFHVVMPATALMPWCDPTSGVTMPDYLMQLDIEVWTTSDANDQPNQSHEPHALFPVSIRQATLREITTQDAIERVRDYRGLAPDAKVELTASEHFIFATGMNAGKHFLITVEDPSGLPADEYLIDAEAGEIVSMYYPRATTHYAPPAAEAMSEEEAIQVAEEWAIGIYPGFEQLELAGAMPQGGVAGIIGSPEADRIYTVEWRLRDPVSGGWLPTGVTVRIDLETGQRFSFEAVLVSRNGPELYLMSEQTDCAAPLDVSGLGFLPGSTVHLYATGQGSNAVDLAAEPLTVDDSGTFLTVLDPARLSGCSGARGSGPYTKRFEVTAITLRNPDDAQNGYANPLASAFLDIFDPGTEPIPSSTP